MSGAQSSIVLPAFSLSWLLGCLRQCRTDLMTFLGRGAGSGLGAIGYEVKVAGRTWLQSEEESPPRLFCGGAWQTATLGAHAEISAVDPKLGVYDALRIEWSVKQLAPGTTESACASKRMHTTFTYYSSHDALAFSQTFPDEIADATTPPQPLCPMCEFNSTSVPRSEFPSFSAAMGTTLHDEIGWWQWGGAMTNARQAGGVGLRGPGYLKAYPDNDGLVGGQEGGPLVLFDEGRALGDVLVFSPMGGWFASVLGMRPLLNHSASPRGNALIAGVQGDVARIPAGHNASFILCATRGKGINAGVQRWGAVLRTKFAVPKLASTVVERKLGYWTDVRGSPPYSATAWSDGLYGVVLPRFAAEWRVLLRPGAAHYGEGRDSLLGPFYAISADKLRATGSLGMEGLRCKRRDKATRWARVLERSRRAHLVDSGAFLLPERRICWAVESWCCGDARQTADAAASLLPVVGGEQDGGVLQGKIQRKLHVCHRRLAPCLR